MMAVFKQAELLLMLAFVAALVLYFTLKLWLNMRQIRFIMAHQHQVPPPFDRRIDLDAGRWDREFVRRGSAFDRASFAFWRGVAGAVQSDRFAV